MRRRGHRLQRPQPQEEKHGIASRTSSRIAAGKKERKIKDLISLLPDNILHSILSFLPTKDAIRTAILSRRWKYIWTSLPNIDLNNYRLDARSTRLFIKFVDRVLMLHDNSDIKRFRLGFSRYISASRVNLWVYAALKHNCQELDLFLPNGSCALPCALFTCESLSVLKLRSHSRLQVPTLVILPRLKSLYLEGLILGMGNSRLFSGCPMLQQLTLDECKWGDIKCITIDNLSMKSLTLKCCDSTFGWHSEVKVCAASLTSFELVNGDFCLITTVDAPSLVNAYVEVLHGHFYRPIKLLSGLHNVRSLNLHDMTLVTISQVENFTAHLPVFHNLTHLQVVGTIYNDAPKALVRFMQKIPNLETLSISEVYDSDYELMEVVPCCLHSKLKTFSISCYITDSGMNFLKFVLENAAVLEMVKIECFRRLSKNSKELELARKEVLLLKKCSENCQIILL